MPLGVKCIICTLQLLEILRLRASIKIKVLQPAGVPPSPTTKRDQHLSLNIKTKKPKVRKVNTLGVQALREIVSPAGVTAGRRAKNPRPTKWKVFGARAHVRAARARPRMYRLAAALCMYVRAGAAKVLYIHLHCR